MYRNIYKKKEYYRFSISHNIFDHFSEEIYLFIRSSKFTFSSLASFVNLASIAIDAAF